MTQRYRTVFIFGFVLSMVNLFYVAAGVCIYLYQKVYIVKIMNTMMVINGVFTLIFMIYASCVIFSESGTLCRDSNYLPKSGNFIFVYLILLYCTVGITLCCGCMFFCVVASNKKKKKNHHGLDQNNLLS